MIVEAKAESRRAVIMQQIAESFEIRRAVHRESDPSIASPKHLYLDDGEWSARLAGSMTFEVDESGAGDDRSPLCRLWNRRCAPLPCRNAV
jgi:hypothetical protein